MAALQEVKDAASFEAVEVMTEINALKAEIQALKAELAALSTGTLISTGTGTLTP